MTDEQINAAIAEACGWVPDCDRGICWDQYGNAIITPPNYCADLNAMHEAEATLTEDQLWIMARQIERNWEDQWYFRATARQRAEAFLRTLGKWKEAK